MFSIFLKIIFLFSYSPLKKYFYPTSFPINCLPISLSINSIPFSFPLGESTRRGIGVERVPEEQKRGQIKNKNLYQHISQTQVFPS